MKRTPELRTLSEDHHHGLVHARQLRRATEADEAGSTKAAVKGFLDFWQKDTALHFRKEEDVLLPVMARYGGDLSREPLVEMIEDQARICLEERVVFPLIEELLSKAALTEFAARLEVKEAGPRVEPWVPAEELSYAPWPGPGDSEGGGYD